MGRLQVIRCNTGKRKYAGSGDEVLRLSSFINTGMHIVIDDDE